MISFSPAENQITVRMTHGDDIKIPYSAIRHGSAAREPWAVHQMVEAIGARITWREFFAEKNPNVAEGAFTPALAVIELMFGAVASANFAKMAARGEFQRMRDILANLNSIGFFSDHFIE